MATIAERLAEAQTALHLILTGKGVAEVRDATGETVRYTRTTIADLRAYIRGLEQEAGSAGGTAKRLPLRPVW